MHIFAESEAQEPILFILADGADPSQELSELATKLQVPYHSISMGQGQEQAAYEAIREAASKGEWLCLNNLHLMLQAVPAIFKVRGAGSDLSCLNFTIQKATRKF